MNQILCINPDSVFVDNANVQLMVAFIMDFLGRRSGRLASEEEKISLKINIETAIIHTIKENRPQMECFFKENWQRGFGVEEFQEMVKHACAINFNKFSAMEFIKYSCRVCLLASFAFNKERKAPLVAESYIFKVVQKYRSKKLLDDKKWVFLNGILFHDLIDNNILP